MLPFPLSLLFVSFLFLVLSLEKSSVVQGNETEQGHGTRNERTRTRGWRGSPPDGGDKNKTTIEQPRRKRIKEQNTREQPPEKEKSPPYTWEAQGVKYMPIIRWGHETEIVDIDWCWKPYLPYGKVSIIEGDGGDGKTTMILTVAAMLSAGIQPPALERGHLLPSSTCDPITTFYLTNEDEVADSSLKRFIRAGGVAERFAYSGELQHHMTINEEELLSAIEETKCRLLIIDPFQAFLPEGTNMGSVTKMRAIFTTLGNVAKMTGVAIVLVGHLNKNEGSKDIHRGFGSADIAASVRSILMVEMDKRDREKRWVRAIKSNFDESDYTPIRLILDEERRLSFAEFEDEEEAEATPPQSKTERAMEIIADMMVDGSVPVAEP